MDEKRFLINELHKQAREGFLTRRVVMKWIDDSWQADLVEMGNYSIHNKGYRYLLTAIEAFSKFSWVGQPKTKISKDVVKAFKNIF